MDLRLAAFCSEEILSYGSICYDLKYCTVHGSSGGILEPEDCSWVEYPQFSTIGQAYEAQAEIAGNV